MFLLVCSNCFAQLTSNKTPGQPEIDKTTICGGLKEIFNIKGKWKKSKPGDYIIFPDKTFPANQYIHALNRVEKVLPMMKEALPDLGGFEPLWHGSIEGNAEVANGPVPYRFINYNFEYYCNNNLHKIMLADETMAKVEICFNDHRLFANKIDDWNISENGKMVAVYQLPEMLGKWKGQSVYQPKISSQVIDRAVVIGHSGKMPWLILTQKQYLTGYKNRLEKNKKEQLEGFDNYIKKSKENIANMQASKALTPEQRNSIVEKLTQQLKGYQNNTILKNIAAAEKIYNDQVKPVNKYLDTASTATLSQQAVLDTRTSIGFKGYFAKDGQPGIKLISFTPNYFNTALPRYVPQFIILYWRWSNDPANLHFAKQLEENFPIQKLQALIDK